MAEVEFVRAGGLRLPPSRPEVDPFKLVDQYLAHGTGTAGMPPLEVTRCRDGELMINSGVTRATRAYRYAGAGTLVPVVVIDDRPDYDVSDLSRVKDLG